MSSAPRSPIDRARRLLRRSPSLRWAFATSLALLPATALALRFAGLRRVHAPAAWQQAGTVESPHAAPAELASMVAAAASILPYRPSCLARAIVLQRLLTRHGIASRLRIGVSVDSSKLDAHAWVEVAGVPLLDRADIGAQYSALEQAP